MFKRNQYAPATIKMVPVSHIHAYLVCQQKKRKERKKEFLCLTFGAENQKSQEVNTKLTKMKQPCKMQNDRWEHYWASPLKNLHTPVVGMCGLADQSYVHKQKVVGSSPVTVNVLCPWVRHLPIITPLNPGVQTGTGNAGTVTGSLWRCSEPPTMEKMSLAQFVSRRRWAPRPVLTGWKFTLPPL